MRLLGYLCLKLASSLVMIVLGAIVVFLLMHAVPGDAAFAALGDQASPAAVAAFRAAHHLNDPLAMQFLAWAQRALRGDLGQSISLAGRLLHHLADRRQLARAPCSSA